MAETKYICPEADLPKLMEYSECFQKCFILERAHHDYMFGSEFLIGYNSACIEYSSICNGYTLFHGSDYDGRVMYGEQHVPIENIHDYLIEIMSPKLHFANGESCTVDDLRDSVLTKAVRNE